MNYKLSFNISNIFVEFNLNKNIFDNYEEEPTFTMYKSYEDRKITIDKDNNNLLYINEIRKNSNKVLKSLNINEYDFINLYKDKKIKIVNKNLYILFDNVYKDINNISKLFIRNHYINIIIIENIDIENSFYTLKKIYLESNV